MPDRLSKIEANQALILTIKYQIFSLRVHEEKAIKVKIQLTQEMSKIFNQIWKTVENVFTFNNVICIYYVKR